MRYPEKKQEYEEYISDVMSTIKNDEVAAVPTESSQSSVTERKALKLVNTYADRLEFEIRAVETVYNELSEDEKKVMRLRYWSNRSKRNPYWNMSVCNYSERQMRRIILKIITKVGKLLGEIK